MDEMGRSLEEVTVLVRYQTCIISREIHVFLDVSSSVWSLLLSRPCATSMRASSICVYDQSTERIFDSPTETWV